jgi:hypothetical protein
MQTLASEPAPAVAPPSRKPGKPKPVAAPSWPWRCEPCGMDFDNAEVLGAHERAAHMGLP